MLQRLLDTVSLTGAQWVLVIALSLVAPAFTAIDKAHPAAPAQPRSTTTSSSLRPGDEIDEQEVREAKKSTKSKKSKKSENVEPASTAQAAGDSSSATPDGAAAEGGGAPDEAQGVRGRDARSCTESWWPCRSGSRPPGRRSASCSRARDTAGKGGTIRRITERASPRVFRVVALPAPTEREKSQMYVQRYIAHFPACRRGRHLRPQLVQPCRCRAGDGLLHAAADRASSSEQVPAVEQAMVESGIILIKYWLEVSVRRAGPATEEQDRRPTQDLEAVAHGPEVLSPAVRLLPRP